MRVLLPLPVIACLLGAGASMAFGRNRIAQRIIGSAALLTALGAAIGILRHVDADGPAAAFMGGWKAPVGIALVADRFTAIMLLVSAVVLLGVLMFAMGQPGTEQEQPSFHPVYLVLAAGVFLSFTCFCDAVFCAAAQGRGRSTWGMGWRALEEPKEGWVFLMGSAWPSAAGGLGCRRQVSEALCQ